MSTPTAPQRIGLVVHTARQAARAAARVVIDRCDDAGIEVVMADEGHDPDALGVPVMDSTFDDDVDVVLSFGGDGTFLRAAHRCRDAGVPLLGVNMGRMGFLTEVEPDQLEAALDRVVAGDWSISKRGTIDMQAFDADGSMLGHGWALNELSIEKSAREHMLHTEISVGGDRYTRFGADAVIVATSTGSTAYALSAGGPIVSPTIDVTLVVLVAPHTLYDRTLIAHPSEHIEVEVGPDQQPAIVSVDGRTPISVPAAGSIVCTGGGTPVKVAQLDPLSFPTLLRRKFNLR